MCRVKVDLTKYIEQHAFNFDDVFDIDATNDYASIYTLFKKQTAVDVFVFRFTKEPRSL